MMSPLLLSLRFKIFLTFLAANVLLVVSLLIINNLAFQNSFRNYIQTLEDQAVTEISNRLVEYYQANGSWKKLSQERNEWRNLVQQSFRKSFDESPKSGKPTRANKPHPMRRLSLKDTNDRLILGRPHSNSETTWRPLLSPDGDTIGYLGLENRKTIGNDFDRRFARQQTLQVIWISAIGFILSALITIPFSGYLVRPIKRINAATKQLTQGNLDISLQVSSRDELGKLSSDFNQLAKVLKLNLEARQQWVTDISHELRTPVANLQAEIEAALDGIRPVGKKLLTSLHQELTRLQKLVSDLHVLSLSDTGSMSYQMASVDLSTLLASYLEGQKYLLAQQEIQLNWNIPPILNMTGDTLRLGQLFENLMQNSQRYTDTPGSILVTAKSSFENIEIIWSDSSPSVNSQELPKLFDRLYRVDPSRNRESGGSGLGLSIAKNIVEAHDGTIEARHSDLGGLSILVSLPQERM